LKFLFQALKGLQLVLSPMENEMEDDDVQVIAGLGTAAEDLTANSEWLLKRLPRLPCFAGYYPQISNALRFACQYENDPLGMLGIFKSNKKLYIFISVTL
jgi:hypothetical protein